MSRYPQFKSRWILVVSLLSLVLIFATIFLRGPGASPSNGQPVAEESGPSLLGPAAENGVTPP